MKNILLGALALAAFIAVCYGVGVAVLAIDPEAAEPDTPTFMVGFGFLAGLGMALLITWTIGGLVRALWETRKGRA